MESNIQDNVVWIVGDDGEPISTTELDVLEHQFLFNSSIKCFKSREACEKYIKQFKE